jgi:hypothetical protein
LKISVWKIKLNEAKFIDFRSKMESSRAKS